MGMLDDIMTRLNLSPEDLNKVKQLQGNPVADALNTPPPASSNFDVGVSDTTAHAPITPVADPTAYPAKLTMGPSTMDQTLANLPVPAPTPSTPPPAPVTPPESNPPADAAPSAPATAPAANPMAAILPQDPTEDMRRREANDAALEHKRRMAQIPAAVGGVADAFATGAQGYGIHAPADTQKTILDEAHKDEDSHKVEFETKLKRDPNSDISKSYRSMVQQIVPEMAKNPAFANMSAEAIGDKLPLIDTMMKAQAQKDAKELGLKNLQANRETTMGFKNSQQQDKLEREGRDMINRAVSTRAGGLGLEDQKVNQAIHLQTMLTDAWDPKTRTYQIPPSMHTELAIGLQRLLSPAGATSQHLVEQLQQKTAREGLAGALIYLGFDPKEIGGTTQSVSDFFAKAVKRQGLTSEKLRDTYIDQFKKRLPTGLSEERKDYLLKQEVGNKYSDYMDVNKSANIEKPKLTKDSLGLF